jgi:hypothetical protein
MAKPMVGDTVWYYPNVLTGSPWLAMIAEVYSDDLLSLAVWEAGRWVSKKSIHNKHCKAVKENPVIAANFGTWEFRVIAEAKPPETVLPRLNNNNQNQNQQNRQPAKV